MASILEPIREKMIEHLEALSALHHALIDYSAMDTQFPFAVMSFGAGAYDSDLDHVLDRDIGVWIIIHGNTRDEVDELLEDIGTLWMGTSNFQDLSDLGVVNIQPDDSDLPMEFGKTDSKPMGYIAFLMTVRYTYT